MEGIKKDLTNSLLLRLSAGLSAAIVVFAVGAGLWSFASAYREADEFQDSLLLQISHLAEGGRALSSEHAPAPGVDPDERIVVRMLPSRPGTASPDGVLSDLPASMDDGLQTLTVKGVSWRLFVHTMVNSQRVVVGQPTAERDEIAFDSGIRTAIPILLLGPFLCGLACVLVWRTLRPVNELAHGLDRRTGWDVHPIPAARMPVEIRPFIGAINSLLGRLGRSAELQRRFIADAAHELRSPLMALSVQIENAGSAMRTEPVAERLAPARQGISRLGILLSQLLSLARVHSDEVVTRPRLPLQPILRQVIEDLMPEADRRGVDVGVGRSVAAMVAAQEIELVLVLRNVLDNAIRYASPGGKVEVDVQSSEKCTTIDVSDDGPGIPEKERGRVFDSFYRVEGSSEGGAGLGLSIVRAIVDRLGGTIGLDWTDAAQRKGLRVTLRLASSSNNVLDPDGVVGPPEASAAKNDRPNSALLRVG